MPSPPGKFPLLLHDKVGGRRGEVTQIRSSHFRAQQSLNQDHSPPACGENWKSLVDMSWKARENLREACRYKANDVLYKNVKKNKYENKLVQHSGCLFTT